MKKLITGVDYFDHKRMKVTLEHDEVTFLLYRGEVKRLGIREGDSLSEEMYQKIADDILIPRAKKRLLYYMRNGDKTKTQMIRKLREAFYPEDVIEETMAFMEKHELADDVRYSEHYIADHRASHSKKEMEMELRAKGVASDEIRDLMAEIGDEEEYEAALRNLRKRYPHGVTNEERGRACMFLARKGYGFETVRKAVEAVISED